MNSVQKLDLKKRRVYSHTVSAFAALSVILSVVCCSVDYWVKITSDGASAQYTGLFLENGTHDFLCDGDMTVAECGYLQGAKSCAVISGIFGLFFVCVCTKYIHFTEGYLTSLGASLATTCGALQFVFGVMCVVYFSYLKGTYFDYDDMNVEYVDNKEAEYGYGFSLMCTTVGLTGAYTIATYVLFVLYNNDASVRKKFTNLDESSNYHSGMRNF